MIFIYVLIKITYIFIWSDLVWDNVDTSLRDKCLSAKKSQFDKKRPFFKSRDYDFCDLLDELFHMDEKYSFEKNQIFKSWWYKMVI